MSQQSVQETSEPDRHGAGVFQDFRAPRGHEASFIQPGLDQAADSIEWNRRQSSDFPETLTSFREGARQQLLRDARVYTSNYRDVRVPDDVQSFVMAGHQPTLFHPGVWFKNFALDRVANQTGSVAVNLVVDCDVAGVSAIRVPHLGRDALNLSYQAVPYDAGGGGVPFEQSMIVRRDLFDSFDRRVADAVAEVVETPLVVDLWKHAREAISRCGFAGCALAQARHRLESDWGLNTLEIPQSVVCRGEGFAQFASLLLMDLPRFHDCYNESTEHYRAVHGIRSRAHPVPNLHQDDEWFEAPLWVYGNESPKRRPLWVRYLRASNELELSDLLQRSRTLNAKSAESLFEGLAAIQSPEFKLRSRALVTTMYARLVLSDLFLHGIGGGKYDQLGDMIAERFFGIQAPKMMVLSASVLLPGHDRFDAGEIRDQLQRNHQQRRDLIWQPDRFRESGLIPEPLLEQKTALLNSIPPRGERSQWHRTVQRINQEMSRQLTAVGETLQREREDLAEQLRDAVAWSNREISFCVFSGPYLKQSFAKMLGGAGTTGS